MQSSMGSEIYHDNRFAIQSGVQVLLLTPTAEQCVTERGDAVNHAHVVLRARAPAF